MSTAAFCQHPSRRHEIPMSHPMPPPAPLAAPAATVRPGADFDFPARLHEMLAGAEIDESMSPAAVVACVLEQVLPDADTRTQVLRELLARLQPRNADVAGSPLGQLSPDFVPTEQSFNVRLGTELARRMRCAAGLRASSLENFAYQAIERMTLLCERIDEVRQRSRSRRKPSELKPVPQGTESKIN